MSTKEILIELLQNADIEELERIAYYSSDKQRLITALEEIQEILIKCQLKGN